MKAVICTEYGAPEVLQVQEVPLPEIGSKEILIKVHAAAVTTAGLIGRKGDPKFTRLFSGLSKPRNNILGMELAGQVESVGNEVTSFNVGDEVFGLASLKLGAHAQYIKLPETAAIIKKPRNLSFQDAVAVIEGGLTSIQFLVNKAKLRPGQEVLIYGASGSVGTAAVQLAKYFGTRVTGVCSTENLKMVKRLRADEVIDYTKTDFTKNGKAYDVIFDTVGKRPYIECKDSLKDNGIYLDTTGFSTVLYMLLTSFFSKKKAILSTTYTRSSKAIKADLEQVKALAEMGLLRPVIDRVYSIHEAAEAHEYVETGRKKGNVVLQLHIANEQKSMPSRIELQGENVI